MYTFHLYFLFISFFFNHTPTTEIYTLSLHDALPISINSSDRPSEKYSSCGFPLSFKSGRTAIDLLLTFRAGGDFAPRHNWKARRAAAMTARPIMNPANFFLLQ